MNVTSLNNMVLTLGIRTTLVRYSESLSKALRKIKHKRDTARTTMTGHLN